MGEEEFRDLFRNLDEDKIHKDIVIDVMMDMIKGTFDLKKYATLSTEELHHGIVEVIKQNPEANFSALMGLCMKKFAGKASGKFISEQLKMILEKGYK
jgi:Glu-tRNA(Gln) amidotransferase subunit E-like FAD-binding protein